MEMYQESIAGKIVGEQSGFREMSLDHLDYLLKITLKIT
jgi:hypothetical protein